MVTKNIEFLEVPYRYLRITDISDDGYLLENDKKSLNEKDAKKYLLSKNDIVFARTGASTGKSFFYEEKFGKLVYAGFLIKFKLDEDLVNPKFVKYYTISQKYKKWIENYQDGSTRENMNANTFANMELELPNRKQQNLAVSILSSLDDKIELNNKINKELENLAKTIYEYWFVQNAEEKWEKRKLSEIAETGSGGTPLSSNKEYYENGNIAWINSSELNLDYIIDTKNFITEKGLNRSSAKLFPVNSILIALYGATAGKVSLLTIPATTNQAICAIMPFSQIHTLYLKFYLSDLYKYFVNVSSGSARDNLSQELIRNLNIILPPKNVLEKFNNIIEPFIHEIITNRQENANLAHLRDFLLPLLMNGEVNVDIKCNFAKLPIYEQATIITTPPRHRMGQF